MEVQPVSAIALKAAKQRISFRMANSISCFRCPKSGDALLETNLRGFAFPDGPGILHPDTEENAFLSGVKPENAGSESTAFGAVMFRRAAIFLTVLLLG